MSKLSWFVGIVAVAGIGYLIYKTFIEQPTTARYRPIPRTARRQNPSILGRAIRGRSSAGYDYRERPLVYSRTTGSPKEQKMIYKKNSLGGHLGNVHGLRDMPIRQASEIRPAKFGTESLRRESYTHVKTLSNGSVFLA